MKKIFLILGLSVATLNLNSCRDSQLEPTLEQEKDMDKSLVSESDLDTFLRGIYSLMKDQNYLGRDYQIYGEVRSDNTYANGNSNRFVVEAEMDYNPNNGNMPATWYRIYQVIGRANLVINKYEGVGSWTPLSGDAEKIKNYVGQAYILRAMAHFDLVRIFGQHYVSGQGGMNSLGVPYVKYFQGDPNNLYPARNTVQEVYDLAKQDIQKAIGLMNPTWNDNNRNFISANVGWALLSRMATYFNDTPLAISASKKVIDSGIYSIVEETNFVNSWKLKNSPNWIFSLYANSSTESIGINSLAYIYRLPASGSGYGDIVGLGNLYNIYELGDVRANASMYSSPINVSSGEGEFRNLGKFPDTINGGDAIPLFRYEEVILNYAEALFKNGQLAEALTQLNKIPAQRGATLYNSVDMEKILSERRKEFAFEGFRFHDLVRTQQGIPLLDATRQNISTPIPYGSSKLAFPIPNTEVGANANMVQNAGY
ncbi:RagB/SusD family nutrient uptake outer membrane protein [Bergeyella zoohelcum]|uniref:SusD family n=1 Tax=Bergeyella zoohelcum TaxID=1015 RepID=A0A376BYI5_9FLAO|nr:RagB/SusD family nutrient uptake outer membrane protein [Bergeyella zoohelcum]EKB61181.1 hypothetical protein HMPREF9700_00676 [Bergeyella zoohelcum CCUG 30536]SSZ46728.1 SusD family [Bergeyella zoohelcum]